MHYLLTPKGSGPPAGYTDPIPHPPVPGVDWYFQGMGGRYREVNRVDTEDGYTLTLERADLPPLLEGVL